MDDALSYEPSKIHELLRPKRLEFSQLELDTYYKLMAELEVQDEETADYSQHIVSIVRLGQTAGLQSLEIEFIRKNRETSIAGFPFRMSPSSYMYAKTPIQVRSAHFPIQEQPKRFMKSGFLVDIHTSVDVYLQMIEPRD